MIKWYFTQIKRNNKNNNSLSVFPGYFLGVIYPGGIILLCPLKKTLHIIHVPVWYHDCVLNLYDIYLKALFTNCIVLYLFPYKVKYCTRILYQLGSKDTKWVGQEQCAVHDKYY